MILFENCFVVVLLVTAVTATSGRDKIDPSLIRVLRSEGRANIFVTFHEGTASALSSFKTHTFESRAEKLRSLTLSLQVNAAITQKPILTLLESFFPGTSFQSFWISNQVYIRDASMDLIERIASISSVKAIEEEEDTELMMPVVEDDMDRPTGEEWSLNIIQVPDAWNMDGGNNGDGIIVSTIDTGVRITHEALKDNYVGEYGWYDPYKKTAQPNDQNGHGTHVTGTIAGQGGIGVAPGARWMACKGCDTSTCRQYALLECGQFIVCPTDTQGKNAACGKAPSIVSNSWGGGQGQNTYKAMIEAWINAGIVPVFANGNAGPRCGSANSPADHPGVIAVGSTTSTDSLSSFSSVGPSYHGDIKPDVSAPGSSVRSSYHTSDTAYRVLSGTSMACPHTAGVIALLLSRNPGLGIAQVKEHLYKSADRHMPTTGKNCGGLSEDNWPNHAFGHGRINAYKALLSLQGTG